MGGQLGAAEDRCGQYSDLCLRSSLTFRAVAYGFSSPEWTINTLDVPVRPVDSVA